MVPVRPVTLISQSNARNLSEITLESIISHRMTRAKEIPYKFNKSIHIYDKKKVRFIAENNKRRKNLSFFLPGLFNFFLDGKMGLGFGCGGGWFVGEKVVVGIAAARDLADLGVPGELSVKSVEGPEPVGANGEAPVLFRLLALLLDRVDVLPRVLIPLLWVLHQTKDQVLCELHHKLHPGF